MREAVLAALLCAIGLLTAGPRATSLFLVILLTTEFYHVELWGGIARPYHFAAVAVVALMAFRVPVLLRSAVWRWLMLFAIANAVAVGLSDDPPRAAASFLAFCGNMAVAAAVALALESGGVTLQLVRQIVVVCAVGSVALGVVQAMTFRASGLHLALSPAQIPQIELGFGPGLRTEANMMAKSLVVPLLFLLPAVSVVRARTMALPAFLVILIGLMLNLTRTVIYGLMLWLPILLFWRIKSRKGLPWRTNRVLVGVGIGGLALVLAYSWLVRPNEYARYKAGILLDRSASLDDASASHRMAMMGLVVDDARSSVKRMLIGNGWGQTYQLHQGQWVQAGGGDIVNVLGYSGLVGVAFYLMVLWYVWKSATRFVQQSGWWNSEDIGYGELAEGVVLSVPAVFLIAQMSGYLINPDFWLLLGLGIHLDLVVGRERLTALSTSLN